MANRQVTLTSKKTLASGELVEITYTPGVAKNMTAAADFDGDWVLLELFDAQGTKVEFDNTRSSSPFVTHQPAAVGMFRARASNRTSATMTVVLTVTYYSAEELATLEVGTDKILKVARKAIEELRPTIALQGRTLSIKGDQSLRALTNKVPTDLSNKLSFDIDGLEIDGAGIDISFEGPADRFPFGMIVVKLTCKRPVTISKFVIGKVKINKPVFVIRIGVSVYNGLHLAPVEVELPIVEKNIVAAIFDKATHQIQEAMDGLSGVLSELVSSDDVSKGLRTASDMVERALHMQRLHDLRLSPAALSFEYEPLAAPTPLAAITTAPAPRSQRLDHLVIVMMENRSFDHMMADIVAGRSDVRRAPDSYSEIVIDAGGTPRIYQRAKTTLHALLEDPSHDSAHQDLQAQGKFVASFLDDHQGSSNGAEVLNYQPKAHLPFFDFLTREFVICDDWRASLRGHTWPNRLYSLSGASKRTTKEDKTPTYRDNPRGEEFEFYTLPTICDVLEAQHVDWAYYKDDFAFVELYRRWVFDQARVRPRAQLAQAIANNTLPKVVWYEPNISDFGKSLGTDDHPPISVFNGQSFLADLYAQLCQLQTKNWMLVVTYDESGGFYDHLPVEDAPDDQPLARKQGFRVPAFLVSPWLQRGKVCTTRFDHASLIRTVLDNFCNPDPIFTANARVRSAASFATVLETSSPLSAAAPRAMPKFTATIPTFTGLESFGEEAVPEQKPLFAAFEAAKRELEEAQPPAKLPVEAGLELAADIKDEEQVRFEGLYIEARDLFPELAAQGWTSKPMFDDAIEARPPAPLSVDAAWDLVHDLRAKHAGVVVDPLWETAFAETEPEPDADPNPGLESTGEPPPQDWHLDAVNARAAWARTPGDGRTQRGAGIIVGHLDTGFRDHPDLRDMLLTQYGWDVYQDDPDPHDDLERGFLKFPGHGTSTASVIGSRGQAAVVMGTAPAVHAIPIRISASVVHLSMSNMVRGIHIAIERNVHVISLSAGGLWSAALHRAVREAIAAGVIVVAAAGNYTKIVVWPARFDEVISCGAINVAGDTWKWSNGGRGEHVTVMAPGEAVWALRVDPDDPDHAVAPGPSSGTSFATACVAGAVATWLGFHGRDSLIARYGASNLARIAKHVVRTTTEKNNEAGVLDIEALLAAPLPDPVLVQAVAELESIDPAADAAEDLGLESLPTAGAADELRFRRTVAQLTSKSAGTEEGLESLELAPPEPKLRLSEHLARLMAND